MACFNRTTSKVDEFIAGRAQGKNIIGTKSVEEFVKALKKPRKMIIMVRAGGPVDATIQGLLPHLEQVCTPRAKAFDSVLSILLVLDI